MTQRALKARAILRQQQKDKKEYGLYKPKQAYQQWTESREALVHPEAAAYYHHMQ